MTFITLQESGILYIYFKYQKTEAQGEAKIAQSPILSDRTIISKTKAQVIFFFFFWSQDLVSKTKDENLLYFSNELVIKKKYCKN